MSGKNFNLKKYVREIEINLEQYEIEKEFVKYSVIVFFDVLDCGEVLDFNGHKLSCNQVGECITGFNDTIGVT